MNLLNLFRGCLHPPPPLSSRTDRHCTGSQQGSGGWGGAVVPYYNYTHTYARKVQKVHRWGVTLRCQAIFGMNLCMNPG